ncbi:hypothetical protein [Paramagnetospirillum marisnigri]|uniref:hypothetical protein n=1 Tax=Paramagnetospirillum marisnigri TaxID=1285242 RepID=UPI0009EE731B|nr:hypothetical protein [Paramagnetospirillum marisnigri]
MDEYAVEVTAKGADGSLEPFHIYVGAPEIKDGVHACLWWCTGFSGGFWQGGASPEQAYREAFKNVARLIHHDGLTLLTTDGAPFHLPDPPDGCEEKG